MIELSIIGILGSLIFMAYSFLSFIRDIRLRVKMKRRERQLQSDGVSASVGEKSHGICIHKQSQQFRSCSKTSPLWYKRLM